MLIHFMRRTLLLAGMATCLSPITSMAQGSALTLRDAIVRVMEVNPKLTGQKFSLAAADARRDQAALRPVIEAGLEVEDIFGTDRLSRFKDAQVTLQLSTVLEFGGKRANRVGAAERERELVLTTFDAEKLDIVAEVTRRFIHLVAAQREAALAQQSLDLAANTRKAVAQRVSAGRGAAVEDRNADVAFTLAEIEVSRAKSDVSQALQSLAAMWSGGEIDAVDAVAELFNLPMLAPATELAAMLAQNPNLLRFASERRVEEAKLRLAESRASADITVGAGVRRLVRERSNAIVLSLSVPLGASGRSAPYTAEARSNLQQVDYREQAARAELTATLKSFHQEAMQRTAELAALREKAVPQAESARELTQSGFNAGRFSLLELLNAQRQWIELQHEAIEAAVAYHNAVIEIERLTARAASVADETMNKSR